MANSDININITANTSDAERNIKSLEKSAGTMASGVQSSWRSVADSQIQAARRSASAIDSQISKIKELNKMLSDTASIARQSSSATPSKSTIPAVSYDKMFGPQQRATYMPPDANAWKTTFSTIDGIKTQQIKQDAAMTSTANNLIKAYQTVGTTASDTASKQQKLNNATGEYDKMLPTLRYALYDVANVTGQVSKALLGIIESTVKASMAFETAFTDIERTTMANSRRLELLNFQFKELARNIPLAFADITRIGSLGAQMNIANSDLAGFTETVAQFAATTNVSIDTAAQSFGALSNLMNIPADQFNNLGSAIAYVGINSVATESEVLSVATAISGVAAQAGVSKEYMIGLSGALASLRVPSEQSRGALTRIFQEVNRAAAEGGQAIQNFGNIVGMSGQEVQTLLKQDGGMEQFFQRFITGLNGMDSQQLTTTLDALSLADIRVTNVLARLSSNLDTVNNSVADSAYGFKNGTILAQLYAKKNEDLASRMTKLNNSVQELSASFGDSLNASIGGVVDWMAQLVNTISDAISTDAGKFFAGWTTVMAGLLGVLGAVVTGLITATAAAAALKTAMSILGMERATVGMQGFVASLFQMKLGFTSVTGSITMASIAAGAFRLALIAIPFVGIIGTAISLFMAMGQSANDTDLAFKNMITSTSGLKTALESDAAAYEKMKNAGASQEELAKKFTIVDLKAEASKVKNDEYSTGVENMGKALDLTIPKLKGLGDEFDNNTRIIGDNTKEWVTNSLLASEEFQKLFENADFTNYINGLSQVGFKLSDLVEIQASGGDTNLKMMKYIADLQAQAEAKGIKIPVAVEVTDNPTAPGGKSYGWLDSKWTDWLTGTSSAVGDSMKGLTQAVGGLGGAYYLAQTGLDGMGQSAKGAGDGMEDFNNKTIEATKSVYLLTDYANDLSTIWKRAFDIRFSAQEGLDKITESWQTMRDEIEAAREEIKTLNSDIDDLTSDKKLKEYFLEVAVAVGDTVKAEQLRSEISKINDDIASKEKDLTKAQDKTNKTLKGNSSAAIENRNAIRGMVGDYQTYIQNLAASGVKQDELKQKIAESKTDFINQAVAMGYSREEVAKYATSFGDMKKAVDAVPRKLTVDFNGDAALTAIKEWSAKLKTSGNNAAKNFSNGFNQGIEDYLKTNGVAPVLKSEAERQLKIAKSGTGLFPNNKQMKDQVTYWENVLKNYYTGGYTGAGGKYQPAGIVHKGEYVVPKEQVNQQTGMPYYMQQPRSFAQGGYVGTPSAAMVYLSPEDRALLRGVGGSGEVVLYANNEAIARSANAGNKSIVAAGGRP